SSWLCACLFVKSVREPDDRNGHVRFDERGEETERWTIRLERPRKTPLAFGAAGPARHRAFPRLHHNPDSHFRGSITTRTQRYRLAGSGAEIKAAVRSSPAARSHRVAPALFASESCREEPRDADRLCAATTFVSQSDLPTARAARRDKSECPVRTPGDD